MASWAGYNSTITMNGQVTPVAASTTFSRTISTNVMINLYLNMPVRVERRYNNAASVYRGPLLFALPIQENVTVTATYSFESKDYMVCSVNLCAWLVA